MPVVEAVHPAGRREDDANQYKKSDGVFYHSHLEAEIGHNISRRRFFRLRIFIQNLIAERI